MKNFLTLRETVIESQDFLIRKPPAVKLKVLTLCIRLKARNLYLVRSEVTKPRIQDKYYIWY